MIQAEEYDVKGELHACVWKRMLMTASRVSGMSPAG